jgi:hypothetical protein
MYKRVSQVPEMAKKKIKVQILGHNGRWITGKGESVPEATTAALKKKTKSEGVKKAGK